MNADRNLLLGILAVQMNFVSRDALILGMNAWVLAKQRPLAEILVEQRALEPSRQRLLEQMVEEHLKTHNDDIAQSLASAPADTHLRDQLQSIADPDLQLSLCQSQANSAEYTKAEPPGTFAPVRFRVLRPHARGGLGEVFVAEDTELHREVALKEMQSKHAENLVSRSRFIREAAITGRLEHPGVVPVYALGQYDDGRPFYAMRFIRGQTLQGAIEEFHTRLATLRRSVANRFESLEFRQLLQRFVAVCNVIAYAHNHGVLHRDIKPANIMLGAYGETLVVDWGLAKVVGGQVPSVLIEEDRTDQPTSDSVPGSSADGQLTVVGQLLGTPAYMSPEQAAGQSAQLGVASDIYSLGATLYSVLTGRPPFVQEPAEGVGEVLQRVQRGTFPLPRSLNPRIPKPLEAICLEAMALDPADRYPSALDLAADLEHWLADEPVSCQPDSWTARLARGIRRRPRTTATLLSLVIILSLVAGGWWLGTRLHHGHIIDRARGLQNQAEEDLSIGDFESAKTRLLEVDVMLKPHPELHGQWSAARGLLDRVESQQRRKQEAEVRLPECLRLIDEAEFHLRGGYWTQLPSELPQPNRALPATGKQDANLTRGIELTDKALAMYGLPGGDRAFEQLSSLGVEETDITRLRNRAGELVFWCALAIERQGQSKPDAERTAARKQAVRLLEQAETLGNHARAVQTYRARFLQELGDNGDTAAAEAARRKATEREPATFIDQHLNGSDASRARRTDEAIAAFQLALNLRPNDYWSLFRLSKALEQRGQLASAEKLMRSCLALRPNDAATCNALGDLLFKMGQYDAAVREFEEAIRRDPDYFHPYPNLVLVHAERKDVVAAEAVVQRCLARGPLPPIAEARLWKHLGLACHRVNRLDDALTHYAKAIALDPQEPSHFRNRSIIYADQRRYAEAAEDLRVAQGLAPKDGELHYVMGNLLAEQGKSEEAIAAFTEALELSPRLHSARYNRGVVLRRLRRYAEALQDQTQCLSEASKNDDSLKNILLERAMCLANLRDYRAALEDLDTLLVQDRSNVAALITRGKVHADLGQDFVRSEEDLTLAIHLNPKEPDAYRSRGLTRIRSEDWPGTIADYQQYLKLAPQAPDAAGIWNDLSIAELHLNRVKESLAALDRAEALGPTASSRTNRGNIHLSGGELDRAIADFEEAIRMDANFPRAWALRGQARLRQGRFQEAATDLQKALTMGKGLYETTLLAGFALHQAGKPRDAQPLLATVARERPDHARGKLAQALLDLQDKKYSTAISGLSRATENPFLNPFALQLRAQAWLGLGSSGAPQALADAEACCAAWPHDAFARFDAARLHAQASALVDTPMSREAALSRAGQLLQEAQQRGWFKDHVNVNRLKQDPAFEVLRMRPEVRELLKEVEGGK